ncbi:enoyl-CoA hydratase-related protein [Rudaeicoccus suwonensis]|uniref:Enoyl-CoA hydratase n=1 Tax=Rudaeicoccus suwonensis TaxID=657409 RepID=A0A561DWZ8_9MICO|nr:enoyl-CoA hydratase-related protein [Rudaeicoccus suwonensis]TWE07883.1 enoyl-CoA hydratase [Rudaeicoccus suwonensis]
MSDELVLRDDVDGVAILTLNRPHRRNAWTVPLQRRYYDRLQQCVEDASVRCIVITGAGSTFCPGADTEELQVYTQTGEFNPEMADIEQPDWYPMTVPKPMIAAINGAAAGFGLVQTMMCDVRLAVPDARLSTAFARRGLPALHAASYLLPRLIGASRATELLVSGRTFTTTEAERIGLVHRLIAAPEFMAEVLTYARDLALNCSPASVQHIKQQLRQGSESSFLEVVADAERREHAALASVDFHEGVMSFVERRPPSFAPLGEGGLARQPD